MKKKDEKEKIIKPIPTTFEQLLKSILPTKKPTESVKK